MDSSAGVKMPTHSAADVVKNEALSDSIFRIRVEQREIASNVVPGQFVMIRPHGGTDPLLGRPLAIYDVGACEVGEPRSIDLVYLVQGNGTRALSKLRTGDRVDIWGPLGNSFPRAAGEADFRHVMLLAGGIGQTPFVAVAKELLGKQRYGRLSIDRPVVDKVTFIWGARTVQGLVGLDDFRKIGIEVHVATEDGSAGTRGRVTDVAKSLIEQGETPTAIFSCGPEPMLEAVAKLGEAHRVPTWVSLETKMACGYGVCFSCVCPVKDDRVAAGWDYSRVCIEGPVFRSTKIAWEELSHF
jgi:dihydroorotate dehydrogenase electron transfer subunit